MRALPIRQPYAELIMLGLKVEEYRSRRTSIRGRVYVYATLNRVDPELEEEIARECDLDVEGLPRGVLVGTVEIYDCQPDPEGGFAWCLRKPERARQPRKPAKPPCSGGFFHPFGASEA
jgi:hypothetical protein